MRSENALLKALNARLGGKVYAAVADPAGGVGGDRIKQAVLYRPSTLELLASASDPRPLFERAPVAATFRQRGGGVFTLVALHLKSKGGCPAAGDIDHGSGCWNLRRSAQAQAVLAFVAHLQRTTGDRDVLLAGDLNSYAAEPPLRLFEGAGYVDAARTLPARDRYSYVYAGRSGTLDYLLASPALAPQVAGSAIWHIDADESALVGAFGHAPAFTPTPQTPYRASDHDPVLVGLALSNESERERRLGALMAGLGAGNATSRWRPFRTGRSVRPVLLGRRFGLDREPSFAAGDRAGPALLAHRLLDALRLAAQDLPFGRDQLHHVAVTGGPGEKRTLVTRHHRLQLGVRAALHGARPFLHGGSLAAAD